MKYVLGSHWTTAPDGWTVLTQEDQDITERLHWVSDSVDLLHVCHVHEHVSFFDGIAFVKEAYRVLKPEGVLRIIGPYIDKLVQFRDDGDLLTRNFVKTQIRHYYQDENLALGELGIDFLDHGQSFLFDSLLKGHNHKFLWTTSLLARVMRKVGFPTVNICTPGDSIFVSNEDCLERKIRGLNVDELKEQGIEVPLIHDMESMVVEARK